MAPPKTINRLTENIDHEHPWTLIHQGQTIATTNKRQECWTNHPTPSNHGYEPTVHLQPSNNGGTSECSNFAVGAASCVAPTACSIGEWFIMGDTCWHHVDTHCGQCWWISNGESLLIFQLTEWVGDLQEDLQYLFRKPPVSNWNLPLVTLAMGYIDSAGPSSQ